MTVQAIFFDFGGVIGHWDRAYATGFESEHGLPEGGLVKAFYGTKGWREVEIGRIPVQDWLNNVDVALREGTGKPAPGAYSIWKSLWNRMDQDVIDLARRLRGNYKVGVLSNTTLMLEDEVLIPNGIYDMWDVIINSARVGIAKPDAGIYQAAAKATGIPVDACVHIDDLENNVRGAQAAGFKGILHHGDFAHLTDQLRSLGIDF